MSSPHYNKYNRDGGDAETHAEELNERRCFPTESSLEPKIVGCNSFLKKIDFFKIFWCTVALMQSSLPSMLLSAQCDFGVRKTGLDMPRPKAKERSILPVCRWCQRSSF